MTIKRGCQAQIAFLSILSTRGYWRRGATVGEYHSLALAGDGKVYVAERNGYG
jgi:hypothetical protein